MLLLVVVVVVVEKGVLCATRYGMAWHEGQAMPKCHVAWAWGVDGSGVVLPRDKKKMI